MSAFLGAGFLRLFVIAWLLVMIAVPIVERRGVRGRTRGISLGVVAQVAVVGASLFAAWGPRATIVVIAVVPLLGWVAEFIGSRTGIPFGRYHYTSLLQPQIHRVPLLIPLAWLMMMPPSWAVAAYLFPEAGVVVHAIVAGYAFMAWDIYLDPHLTKWEFWTWDQDGWYEGIPLINFVGWFAWAAVISFTVLLAIAPAPLNPTVVPLPASAGGAVESVTAVVAAIGDSSPSASAGPVLLFVYLITWLLQAGGHAVFWGWRRSAIAGFVAMGIVAVPALIAFLS